MRVIYNSSTDPAYNLALEEVMLTACNDDVAMLWRNSPAVIIGRNQNAIEELDLDFVKQNGVSVIRRMTGGGAVFHDLGNINFTFIQRCGSGDFNNYDLFTVPVRDYLRSLGAECELSGRNDLLIDGMKISGNAQTVKKGRILHHGTMLYSADLTRLAGALRARDIKVESKGIKSHRSRVVNIVEKLKQTPEPEQFLIGMLEYFLNNLEGAELSSVSADEKAAAEKLAAEKYGRWEWNFGESPRCEIYNAAKFGFGVVEVSLSVEEGVISELKIYGDFFGEEEISGLEELVKGTRFDGECIREKLEQCGVGRYISGMDAEELTALMMK
ncbi:MAG: lipoate--protein ligase [Oscillospiraceae bacterium]|nr:lipoate--protein ligase [Oscillospiraceae bacterium]